MRQRLVRSAFATSLEAPRAEEAEEHGEEQVTRPARDGALIASRRHPIANTWLGDTSGSLQLLWVAFATCLLQQMIQRGERRLGVAKDHHRVGRIE